MLACALALASLSGCHNTRRIKAHVTTMKF